MKLKHVLLLFFHFIIGTCSSNDFFSWCCPICKDPKNILNWLHLPILLHTKDDKLANIGVWLHKGCHGHYACANCVKTLTDDMKIKKKIKMRCPEIFCQSNIPRAGLLERYNSAKIDSAFVICSEFASMFFDIGLQIIGVYKHMFSKIEFFYDKMETEVICATRGKVSLSKMRPIVGVGSLGFLLYLSMMTTQTFPFAVMIGLLIFTFHILWAKLDKFN